jgi:hypothetical protein
VRRIQTLAGFFHSVVLVQKPVASRSREKAELFGFVFPHQKVNPNMLIGYEFRPLQMK